MKALWQIILAILWRLRPVQALEVNLRDIIEIGLSLFADDLEVEILSEDSDYRREIAAALADAHAKLDLLIYLRACELTHTRHAIRSFNPNHGFTHGATTLDALWRSFQRLIAKFDDYERLAKRRAASLKREATPIPPSLRDSPLRLDAAHQSTSPARRAVEDATTALSPPSRKARGRWRAHVCARDEGGCALARGWLNATGPPQLPIPNSQLPHLAGFTREIASTRLNANDPAFAGPPAIPDVSGSKRRVVLRPSRRRRRTERGR